MKFTNKVYDVLKFIALIALPAFAVLYGGLGSLWNWGATDQVVGSVVLVDTFLGALLQISSQQYSDGALTSQGVDPDTGLPDIRLTLNQLPHEVLNKKTLKLKVDAPNPPTHD